MFNNLEYYKTVINDMDVLLVRDVDEMSIGRLYLDGKMAGKVPYGYTLEKIIGLEDENYSILHNLNTVAMI